MKLSRKEWIFTWRELKLRGREWIFTWREYTYIHTYIIYIYIYMYTYIYIYGQYAHSPPPHPGPTGALWGKVRYPPPPILGSGNTKKHVLEVNWMVISGYLPL